MSESIEATELKKFYFSLMQDLKAEQLTDEEGGSLEEIFTRFAVNLLADTGETENVRVAYDERQLGTKNQHKINAYGEPDNYETIDLFITIFKGTDEPVRIYRDEIDTAVKRISNFYRKAKYKQYINEIEESSPIFDFANTLSSLPALEENLVRINAIILTDGLYPGEIPKHEMISSHPIYYRAVDLNYLYNITEKDHVPIEINFLEEGFELPCIMSPSENDQYQSYLAIMPGKGLATIYERYGSRLLEQNVRSFLQFTGKVNKGIRKTIIEEPHMFLAFNNGIAATAETLEIKKSQNGNGSVISKVTDFQIVNGGQTTASIYHTYKKDKANIDKIFVPVKLTIVKNKPKFSEIVSRVAEYANTQNKVSVSDLSSNNPYHVQLEKLSRNIFTPHIPGQNIQTKWFYERAKGQYKNARIKGGFTKAKQKEFDLKNPKSQLFTKEDLAKYINVYKEVYSKSKLVIGPHIVVRGNQKNYTEFVRYNLIEKPDNVYFEDVVAKAIFYRKSEKIYGVKPNSIGDMRYISVPYSIALLSYHTENRIDLFKIWKNQDLSEQIKELLYRLMVEVEKYIKATAPGALYGEWAKKEDCWNMVKKQTFGIDFKKELKNDFESTTNPTPRMRLEEEETHQVEVEEEIARLKDVPQKVWQRIVEWGRETKSLTPQKITYAINLPAILRRNEKIDDQTRQTGIMIIDQVIKDAPAILEEIDQENKNETIIKLIRKMAQWDTQHKKLAPVERQLMIELVEGKRELNDVNKAIVTGCMKKLQQYGFGQKVN
jgi:hypothetical protein